MHVSGQRLSKIHGIRACSTLDGHPDVNQSQATQVFLLLANTSQQSTPFAAYGTKTDFSHMWNPTYVHVYIFFSLKQKLCNTLWSTFHEKHHTTARIRSKRQTIYG